MTVGFLRITAIIIAAGLFGNIAAAQDKISEPTGISGVRPPPTPTPTPTVPYVADQATLATTLTKGYQQSGIVRLDYSTGLGAPPVYQVAMFGTTCASQGLTSDGVLCTDVTDGSWVARYGPAGIDSREAGMSSTATAAQNETRCLTLTAAAFKGSLQITFAGGRLPINPGCNVYAYQLINFATDTWLVMQADGAALGSLGSPGAPIGATNGDGVLFAQLQVDMNNHQGAAFLGRAGIGPIVRGLQYLNPRAGSWTDSVGVTDSATTANGSTLVNGLSTFVGRVGMVATDSKGCIPVGDQVAVNNEITAVTAGSFVVGTSYTIATLGTTNFTLIGASSNTVGVRFIATGAGSGTGTATPNTLTLDVATTTGCGAGDNLTFYPIFPSAAIIDSAYYNGQGAYYAQILEPEVRVTADTGVATYPGSGNTFTVDDATGIVAMTGVTITGATWNGAAVGTITYTTSTATTIAAGQLVCIQGALPAGYNMCGPASRGTYGHQVVVSGVITNPGAYSSGGAVYSGGSFVVDGNDPTHMPTASFVYSLSGTTVTVANPSGTAMPGTFAVGDQITFTRGGIGVLFTGTGAHDNPNGSSASRGKMQGFQVGQEDFQGNNIHTAQTDYSLGCYGLVIGGNGLGQSSASVALQDTDEASWYEYQMCGTAVFLTADSTQSCVGGCTGKPIASFSSPVGNSSQEIVDQGVNNNAQIGSLRYLTHQTFTPVWTCGSGAVSGYTSPRSGDYSRVDTWAIVSIEIQASGSGTCAGGATIALPLTSTNPARQACSITDFTTNATIGGWEAASVVNFASAAVTDRYLAHCEYSIQ